MMVYQVSGAFSAGNPLSPGRPRSRFGSKQKSGEPLKLFVLLNFDEGDPVEVFSDER